ncbi:MAG: diol dehydratase small subunit [Blautia sp.]
MSNYPLGVKEADTITSKTGKRLDEITLDEVKKVISQQRISKYPPKC